MTPILRWSRGGVGVSVLVGLLVLGLAGCDDDNPPSDAGDGDADRATADADEVEDTGNYPPFDCIRDDENNMTSCMLTPPDGGTERVWGTWCDGDCRPTCYPPTECDAPLVCKRHGVSYLCFPE